MSSCLALQQRAFSLDYFNINFSDLKRGGYPKDKQFYSCKVRHWCVFVFFTLIKVQTYNFPKLIILYNKREYNLTFILSAMLKEGCKVVVVFMAPLLIIKSQSFGHVILFVYLWDFNVQLHTSRISLNHEGQMNCSPHYWRKDPKTFVRNCCIGYNSVSQFWKL